MFEIFRAWCERLLRIPAEPAPPPGDGGSACVFRAAPAYLKYQVALWCIGNGVTVLAMLVGLLLFLSAAVQINGNRGGGALLVKSLVVSVALLVFLLLIVRAIFSLAVLRLNYDKRWYVVTDRSLRVREGVMTVREMTVTFANIQNVSVVQGPIQRALGISDLKVETAGGGSARPNEDQVGPNLHTAWFRGIDNAEEVRELIQQRLRALKDTGLGHREEISPAAPAPAGVGEIDALKFILGEARGLREAVAQVGRSSDCQK
jgi:membrane protein YdbS with pleckstrin-like domain